MNTTIEVAELRAFTAVIIQGSFTAAAEKIGTDKAHVSRIITRLETKLGARLLERSTRRLHVTEIGREVYERASSILFAIEETENTVAHAQSTPTGLLKLTAGPEFGVLIVNQWIAEYLQTYQEMKVEAKFTNRLTDVIHEGFDVAIRVGSLPDSELSARKIGEINYGFYASPLYLQKKGKPESPNDLMKYDLVGFSPRRNPEWKLVNGFETISLNPDCRYIVNNNQAALGMTIDGLGISLLPHFMAEPAVRNGTLDKVLHEWRRIPVPVHAVFASNRYMAPKVRTFVDIAVQRFQN